jgi:phosphate transporter
MKFGKLLKEHSVASWQEYYMSYKRLKRIIKKLCLQLKEKQEKSNHNNAKELNTNINTNNNTNKSSKSSNSNNSSPAVNEVSKLLMFGGDARKEFFAVFESDIDKVNRFYKEKQLELLNEYERIAAETLENIKSIELPNNLLHNSYGNSSNNSIASDAESSGSETNRNNSINSASFSGLDDNSINNNIVPNDLDNYIAIEQVGLVPRYSIDSDSNTIYSSAHPIQHQTNLSNTQQKAIEEKSNRLLELYRSLLQLLQFAELNFEGLRKIMKKFDKNTGENHQQEYIARMKKEPFQQTSQLHKLSLQAEQLYYKLNLARGVDINSSSSMLRNIVREVKNPKIVDEEHSSHLNYIWIILSVMLAIIFYYLPLLPDEQIRAKKCLSIMAFVTTLWITEAIPFFVASLSIPFLVIILGILIDPITGQQLSSERASRTAFGYMFNDTVMLILGGFSISAAFSKCQFELRLASIIQRSLGQYPRLFLLAFMLLGSFLSMWISNVAAPVLLTSLLLPIVRDFGSSSPYARSLLLGLAISCNIGGMMSPISSPQNAIALGYLQQSKPEDMISFGEWLTISIPYCTISVILSWLYLIFIFLRTESSIPTIPTIVFEKTNYSTTHVITILTSLTTILLWCSLTYSRPILGTMGTVAVAPVVILFGTGILTKNDLTAFSWHLILLIGGGNVLGAAVNSSKLLNIVGDSIEPYLHGHSLYITASAILLLVFFITTFVSHTVAALILTPLVVTIGNQAGQVRVILMLATLMMSGTMSLPMSSFPNINSLLVDDDFNRPFIHPKDYISHGTVISVGLLIVLATAGYALSIAVLT